ncbi:MAG: hypothetical protein Q8M58_12505 [Anaerolineales bacterium]|nr:hypothetical protein [Anaerolineales bacterium]
MLPGLARHLCLRQVQAGQAWLRLPGLARHIVPMSLREGRQGKPSCPSWIKTKTRLSAGGLPMRNTYSVCLR